MCILSFGVSSCTKTCTAGEKEVTGTGRGRVLTRKHTHSYIRPHTVPLVHVIVTEDEVYRHTEPRFENTDRGSHTSPTNYELCGFTNPGRLEIKDGKEDMRKSPNPKKDEFRAVLISK